MIHYCVNKIFETVFSLLMPLSIVLLTGLDVLVYLLNKLGLTLIRQGPSCFLKEPSLHIGLRIPL